MFTHCCYIRENTPKIRQALVELGYKYKHIKSIFKDDETDIIFAYNGYYSYHIPPNTEIVSSSIFCGVNVNLFLAIAALRDDSDKHQWFVHKTKSHWIKSESENFENYFNESNEDQELKCEDFHKASIEELIDQFWERRYCSECDKFSTRGNYCAFMVKSNINDKPIVGGERNTCKHFIPKKVDMCNNEIDKKSTHIEDRHCSSCTYFWSGNGCMYCTHPKMQKRVTAGRRNGCKYFEVK